MITIKRIILAPDLRCPITTFSERNALCTTIYSKRVHGIQLCPTSVLRCDCYTFLSSLIRSNTIANKTDYIAPSIFRTAGCSKRLLIPIHGNLIRQPYLLFLLRSASRDVTLLPCCCPVPVNYVAPHATLAAVWITAVAVISHSELWHCSLCHERLLHVTRTTSQ
jgi:hypothetical protein